VAADPTLAPAYHSLGFLYYGAGDLTRSAAAFATVLRLTHGSHAEARYNLGVVLGDLGRWDEAAADYRAALELDPGNADLRRNLDFTVRRGTYELIESGTGAYMRGDFALAAQEWDRAAALDPANETAAALAAKAHLKIGPADPEPATGTAQAPAFDRVATKAEEAEDRSVLAQGLDLLALGRLAEASAPLAFYHRGHPDDAAAATAYFRCRAGILTGTSDLMREAQLALEAGDAKAAVRGFEKVLALDPGNPVAREMAEKLSPHTAKSRLNPEDARRRYIEGVAQYMKGRLPEAAAIWGALVKDDPADMEARRSLARVQAEMRALRSRGGA
jgi:tetratricopeptide (TPR) repeat protein